MKRCSESSRTSSGSAARSRRASSRRRRRLSADSKLAPRDVQRLLRAGKPVEQVAKQAGVDVAWIERFLGPVLDERAVAIRDSQNARLEKPRLGLSSLPLGEAVARNLRARRVRISDDELKAAWDASRSDSQPWVISLTFPYRGREQRAVWRFDPRTGEVSRREPARERCRLGGGLATPGRRRPALRALGRPRRSRQEEARTQEAAARKSTTKKSSRHEAPRGAEAQGREKDDGETPGPGEAPHAREALGTEAASAPKRRPAARKAATKRRAPAKRRTTVRRASKRGRR